MRLVVLALGAFVAACTTTSSVVAVGADTYAVTAQTDLGPNKSAAARQGAIDAANKHCAAMGKRAMLEKSTDEDVGQAGIFQLRGGTTLTFRCIAPAA